MYVVRRGVFLKVNNGRGKHSIPAVEDTWFASFGNSQMKQQQSSVARLSRVVKT